MFDPREAFDEDQILDRIDVQRFLATLAEEDRVLMLLVFNLEFPADYDGPVPTTHEAVGIYIGNRYRDGDPIAEGTVRYRRDKILVGLRKQILPKAA